MKLFFLFALLVVGAYARHGVPATQIVAISPYRIRRGYPFDVLVRRFGERKRLTVDISITGLTDGGEDFEVRKSVYIRRSRSDASVTFDVSLINFYNSYGDKKNYF
jgi:hypothetical protein